MVGYRVVFWAVALSTVLVSEGVAQGRQTRPSADELVRQYADGENDRALEVSGYPCPADDEYRDEVFRGLLSLEQTDLRLRALAGAWKYALSQCVDQRMADWYRLHITQTDDTYAFLALGLALAGSPTPANLEALKDGAFRDDLSERVRTEVLAAARTIDAEEQIKWLVDGFRSGRSIPVGYLDNRFKLGIIDNGAIGRARAQILAAVRARPDLPKSEDLIGMLAGEALGPRGEAAWREQLRRALEQVAADPRATAGARAAAQGASADIARSNRL